MPSAMTAPRGASWRSTVDDLDELDVVSDCEAEGAPVLCGVCVACREYAALERAREASTRGGIAAWALSALRMSDLEEGE